MGRGTWWATVHGVAQSRTRLSDLAQPYTDLGIIYNLEMISSGWMLTPSSNGAARGHAAAV